MLEGMCDCAGGLQSLLGFKLCPVWNSNFIQAAFRSRCRTLRLLQHLVSLSCLPHDLPKQFFSDFCLALPGHSSLAGRGGSWSHRLSLGVKPVSLS